MANEGTLITVGLSPSYFEERRDLSKTNVAIAVGEAAKTAVLMFLTKKMDMQDIEKLTMKFELKRELWDWHVEATLYAQESR